MQIFSLDKTPGRTTFVDRKEHLFFSGYAYLGMSHCSDFVELAKQGIGKFGLLHPSSRISNTRLAVYDEMETMLSTLTGMEETVTFSSGYLSGRAAVELLVTNKERCYLAPATHPAIQHIGKALQTDWKENFVSIVNTNSDSNYILLADSVNPLNASITDFSFLKNIDSAKTVTCVIDDSHGIGLIGKSGEGISSLLAQLPNVEFVITYSLSKAFHINGGAISCSKIIADRIRQSPYYTASTALAPFMAYAFVNGQHIYQEQRKKLQQNILKFQQLINEINNIRFHPELPMFILGDKFNQDYFDNYNIIISSFAYPDPAGKQINRAVVNALHTDEDLKRLAEVIVND